MGRHDGVRGDEERREAARARSAVCRGGRERRADRAGDVRRVRGSGRGRYVVRRQRGAEGARAARAVAAGGHRGQRARRRLGARGARARRAARRADRVLRRAGPDVERAAARAARGAGGAAAAGADRRARFVCALHFIDAAGRELAATGTVDGEIAPEERGELGFSFDPVFFYPPAGRTFAELTADEKNRVSHRAVAAKALLAALASREPARAVTRPAQTQRRPGLATGRLVHGAPRRTRTFNQLIKSQLLYH